MVFLGYFYEMDFVVHAIMNKFQNVVLEPLYDRIFSSLVAIVLYNQYTNIISTHQLFAPDL